MMDRPASVPAHIALRRIETLEEYAEAEQLQQDVWQSTERLITPVYIMRIAQKSGGLVLGAFDEADAEHPRLIGFLFSFLGWTAEGVWKHCSHMLAVRTGYRNLGIGQWMKRAQYGLATAQGIPLITWTVDPLECRNNHINFHKLGGLCRTYHRNLYGYGEDALNGGNIPTDRFEVEWHVGDAGQTVQAMRTRVERALDPSRSELLRLPLEAHRAADRLPDLSGTDLALLEVPEDFQALKQQDLARARAVRMGFRTACEALFEDGFAALDLMRRDGRMWYLMVRTEVFA